ncbi:MAG: DNA cytosine methyltransferase [Myxococcus sp.]|nr:DNA cytosine methyltransferase [Myxococcus sp.]
MKSAISLFSGAGGMDYGFEAAGFETKVAVEFDHDCCETLRKNRDFAVIERDIMKVPTAEMLEAGGLKQGDVSLLFGGPPCQPFSKAGYWARGDSKRLEDPRANTLWAYMRVVEEALPQAFVLENVSGLAFSGKDEGLQLLLERIKEINKKTKSNYQPSFKVLNAAGYGVPQIRERFFIVASREGERFNFPTPSFEDPSNDSTLVGLEPYRTAWDAIGDLPEPADEDLAMRGKWAKLLPSIPEGQNYLWHTDRGGGLPLFGWRRRYWSFLLKLAKNRPSWTIQAQPGPAIGPFHWKSRRLSARELCRIQTFPDDVEIVGSRTSVQKQIGNAVPSLLAEVVGRALAAQVFSARRSSAPKLLPLRRQPVPAAERVGTVRSEFRLLSGVHVAHPGTGRGNRSQQGVLAST